MPKNTKITGRPKKPDKLIKNQIYLTPEANQIINRFTGSKGLFVSAAIVEKLNRKK